MKNTSYRASTALAPGVGLPEPGETVRLGGVLGPAELLALRFGHVPL